MPEGIIVPQLDWPLRLSGDGSFAVVEQDSLDDVTNNVLVLLNTRVGEREELPEYGIADPAFMDGVDTGAITDAIDTWEPRASVTFTMSIDSADELVEYIEANVEVTDA